jgi:hypothetical protein
MPSIIITNEATAVLFYHPDTKIIHHHFRRDLTSEDFRDVLNRGLELMKMHGAIKWLSDNRAIEPHSVDDAEWVNADWLPRAIALGWRYWALVGPYSPKARIHMRSFVEYFNSRGVKVRIFDYVDEAMHWLEVQE